jgi:hypothetical protein
MEGMGLLDALKRWFGGSGGSDDPYHGHLDGQADGGRGGSRAGRLDVSDLCSRLGLPLLEVQDTPVHYQEMQIPKRSGGRRILHVPGEPLKQMQRRILHRVLGRLRAHPSVHGFEKGRSIRTNAAVHVDQDVVIRMDVREFFPSTTAQRVEQYFRRIGWDKRAAKLLTRLTTHNDGLPQGAPSSPRLANLVNYQLDVRLAGLVEGIGGNYTRYADDLTFSYAERNTRDAGYIIPAAKRILADYGYRIHHDKKLHIRRRHQRQIVTGLVINGDAPPRLPRDVRRRLRAVRHHVQTGRPASLTETQLAGWDAMERMLEP